MRRECLGNFVCVSLDQLDYLITTYVRHYLTERPHQGKDIGNEVLDPGFTSTGEGEVKCRSSLGGMSRCEICRNVDAVKHGSKGSGF